VVASPHPVDHLARCRGRLRHGARNSRQLLDISFAGADRRTCAIRTELRVVCSACRTPTLSVMIKHPAPERPEPGAERGEGDVALEDPARFRWPLRLACNKGLVAPLQLCRLPAPDGSYVVRGWPGIRGRPSAVANKGRVDGAKGSRLTHNSLRFTDATCARRPQRTVEMAGQSHLRIMRPPDSLFGFSAPRTMAKFLP
jgi:hypothetical protein